MIFRKTVLVLFCTLVFFLSTSSAQAGMSGGDIDRYKNIFAAQEKGDWAKAEQLMLQLEDRRLVGHVLKQRYLHPTSYVSKYEELKSWLDSYNDNAGADEIYRLAVARKPASAPAPQKPQLEVGLMGGAPSFSRENLNYKSTKKLSNSDRLRAEEIKAAIKNDLKCCGSATRAMERLEKEETKRLLDPVEIDIIKGRIANTYFFLNRTEKAFKTASEAADRSSTNASLAAWIAGLSAWRLQDYENAAKYFEISAKSPAASGWVSSASAFWTSRAYLRIRKPQEVNKWLIEAAKEPRTFYGLIARRALGVGFEELNWEAPEYKSKHRDVIQTHSAGLRAVLLLDVDQKVLAEQELMQIHPRGNKEMEEALIAFAGENRFPALLMRMSTALKNPAGRYYDSALYPLGWWEKDVAREVDIALVHALIKQESHFNPHAYNPSGATGLMQLLPATANFISKESYEGKNRYKLMDPSVNVALGEKYIRHLLDTSYVNSDLFKTVISYNAGPGNMARWFKEVQHNNDPLLFIESIPVEETRVFVEKVMTNYWIYRLRLGQRIDSLDEVVEGRWPKYTALDE